MGLHEYELLRAISFAVAATSFVAFWFLCFAWMLGGLLRGQGELPGKLLKWHERPRLIEDTRRQQEIDLRVKRQVVMLVPLFTLGTALCACSQTKMDHYREALENELISCGVLSPLVGLTEFECWETRSSSGRLLSVICTVTGDNVVLKPTDLKISVPKE